MRLKRFILSVLISGTIVSAGAVPAKRGLFTIMQPDGTALRVQRVGDECKHFLLTEDRQLIVRQSDGVYCYSRIGENGLLESTGIAVTPLADRDEAAMAVMQSYDAICATKVVAGKKARSRAISQTGMGRFTSKFPRAGKIKALVLLVQYRDVKFKLSDPYSYFYDMLNGESFTQYGGTGSARQYFLENSHGLFDPDFDVYGPYTLPENMSYYGANDDDGQDQAPEDMVVHACNGLDSQINFADYDMDGDGNVDNVFVIYAGQGEASYGSENSVWPHQWDLSSAGKIFALDGKYIDRYGCTNEWESSRPDGVGTFIHEFSHVMGLPDLYATDDGSNSVTPGEWSVLDYGPYNNDGRTPPNYSIYERNAMGWCEPCVLDGPETVTLKNITETNGGCIIPTTRSTEFFLVENRQQTGWDKYLPGHGMLVWHVDFVQSVWDNNAVNNTPSHMYVELEKADGTNSLYRTGGWSFPGTSGKTSFTNTTKPSMKTWNGTNIDMPITDIAETNGIITFNIAGGRTLPMPAFSTNPVTASNGVGSFSVTWLPVEGATDYLVTVSTKVSSPVVEENYDSKTIPAGWSKSSGVGTYTSTGNYLTGTQSLKLSATGHSVTTRTYDNDVAYISFWYKGQQSENSNLAIDGLVNGVWVNINNLMPGKNEVGTMVLDDLPSGVRGVRFVYTKVKGNMSLDDITVRTGGDVSVTLPGYNDVSTRGATTIVVDVNQSRADVGSSIYCVAVKATDGVSISRAATIDVDLASLAGIDGVIIDDGNSPVEYYNLQGIKVDNPKAPGLYLRRQGTKTVKILIN